MGPTLHNMNNIASKQNDQVQLDLLFSQRQLYSSAKKLFFWRSCAAVIFAVIGPILSSVQSIESGYVAVFAIAYLFLDNLILERMEVSKKILAAKIQELFDVTVLGLKWNDIVVGKKPDKETIAMILSSNKDRDYIALKLADWYSPKVSDVDLSIGRFLCQRSNVWWDSTLRKRYLNFLYVVLASIFLVVVLLSVYLNMTIINFILGIIFPIIPLAELLIKQIKEHTGSNCCSTELKENLDKTLDSVTMGIEIKNDEILARTYQDEIFRHRSKCPMVFDFMYWIFRDNQEGAMRFSVEEKVKEINKRS